MHNFNCSTANLARRTADKIDALLQKLMMAEQALPRPAMARIRIADSGAATIATRLDSAKRAYTANRHALSATDALIERLYR